MLTRPARVAIVWRGDAAAATAGIDSNPRLRPVVDAFHSRGVDVATVVYRDEVAAEIETSLANASGVLVWVDPIGGGKDRAVLDPMLRRLSNRGVLVSAHPDVIDTIGTKEVLHTTRELTWGADVHRYDDPEAFRHEFPRRLAVDGPRVLKQPRGNGGIGVWKVELLGGDAAGTKVAVHHAHVRDLDVEEMSLEAFMRRCDQYFDGGGCLIDQQFQARVSEGLIRVYLVAGHVVGFAHQGPGDLINQRDGAARLMGLPSPKTMFPPHEPRFAALRALVESEWIPAMQALLDLPATSLPVLWDTDFLLGPPSSDGSDAYVLCEINASCVTPFPPEAVDALVDETIGRLASR